MKNETAKRNHSPETASPTALESGRSIDLDALERAFAMLVDATPLEADQRQETARRAAEAWAHSMLDGYAVSPETLFSETYPVPRAETARELVLVKDIDFHGLCPHHLLPFRGVAHVAYVPSGNLASLSAIARLVHCFAHRLEIQEVVTRRIGESLMRLLPAAGAAVALSTDQACMSMRGVKQTGAKTLTRYFGGLFHDDPSLRGEFVGDTSSR